MPRSKTPVTHPTKTLVHGTRTTYANYGCGCDECRKANSAGQRRTRLKQFYGTYDRYVDSAPIREHLEKLNAAGISIGRVSELTGISRNGLIQVLKGRTRRALQTTSVKVLAIRPDPVRFGHPNGRVPALGAARRIQALCAIGYSMEDIGARIGVHRTNIGMYASGKWQLMSRRLFTAVLDLYEDCWDQPGGNERAARKAAERGWVPPLAWDDDALDDPAAVPDTGKRTRRADGQFENLEWLLSAGVGWEEACRRAGYSSLHGVKRAAHAKGRQDLVADLPDPHTERISFQKSA